MDIARIGHVGAELLVVGGAGYVLYQQNQGLQTKVDDLQKQLAHVALHTRNLHQSYESRLAALEEKIKATATAIAAATAIAPRERAPRAREILRATAIDDDDSPRPSQLRGHKLRDRLPAQEAASPVPPPPAEEEEEDEESDVEAVLKRA